MGITFSSLWSIWFRNTEYRLLMLGLDAAGKTTILYKLKLGELITSIPTIGFNVESVQYRNLNFTIWDVGGQEKIRKLWSHYYHGTQGLIFVIDSNDHDRTILAAEELHRLLQQDELLDAVILILANKQDLPHAQSMTQLAEKLSLSRVRQQWFIQPCCAMEGQGLYEGLEWLANAIGKK